MTGVVPLCGRLMLQNRRASVLTGDSLLYTGVYRRAKEQQHHSTGAETGRNAYPTCFPLPQVSQLEPEPLAKWMGGEYARRRRGG